MGHCLKVASASDSLKQCVWELSANVIVIYQCYVSTAVNTLAVS